MSYALQLSFPNFGFELSRKVNSIGPQRFQNFSISCSPLKKFNSPGEDSHHRREEGQPRVILVERYGNGTSKRYMLDEDSRLRTFLEENESGSIRVQSSKFSNKELSWLPDIVKDFILPAGFPGSVSDDYLEYIMLQFPTNVTAWICHALVTSSLLKARQSNLGR